MLEVLHGRQPVVCVERHEAAGQPIGHAAHRRLVAVDGDLRRHVSSPQRERVVDCDFGLVEAVDLQLVGIEVACVGDERVLGDRLVGDLQFQGGHEVLEQLVLDLV